MSGDPKLEEAQEMVQDNNDPVEEEPAPHGGTDSNPGAHKIDGPPLRGSY